jgi:hypothetical protein
MRIDQEGRQRQRQNSIQAIERTVRENTNHSGRHCGGFHMFGPMKEAVRGIRFSSDELVKEATKGTFFSDGIKKKL